jgi:hypothetical protein
VATASIVERGALLRLRETFISRPRAFLVMKSATVPPPRRSVALNVSSVLANTQSDRSRQCARFFGRARRRPEWRSSRQRFGKFGGSVANIPWTSVDGEAARVCRFGSNDLATSPGSPPSVFFPAEEIHKCIPTDPSWPLTKTSRQAFVNKCKHAGSKSGGRKVVPRLLSSPMQESQGWPALLLPRET